MHESKGSSFDYANVIYSIIQDCEHRRRSFSDDTIAEDLLDCARDKLGRIRQSYLEGMGSKAYWRELEKEVLETVMPQYLPAAVAMNRKERAHFGAWRGGDLLARFAMAIAGLVIGGLIIALPFIPTIENVFAFAFALGGWFYPDLIRMMHERRHYKLLNEFVKNGEAYQRNRARYVSSADLDDDDDDDPEKRTPAQRASRPAEKQRSLGD